MFDTPSNGTNNKVALIVFLNSLKFLSLSNNNKKIREKKKEKAAKNKDYFIQLF